MGWFKRAVEKIVEPKFLDINDKLIDNEVTVNNCIDEIKNLHDEIQEKTSEFVTERDVEYMIDKIGDELDDRCRTNSDDIEDIKNNVYDNSAGIEELIEKNEELEKQIKELYEILVNNGVINVEGASA